MQANMENPEDRIAGALHDEEMIEAYIKDEDPRQPERELTLLEMVDEGIAASERAVDELKDIREFILDNNNGDTLPKIVKGSLFSTLLEVYHNSRQFNSRF